MKTDREDAALQDQDALVRTLYRMAGLVEAIELARNEGRMLWKASQAIEACCSALMRDALELMEAAEAKRILVSAELSATGIGDGGCGRGGREA